MTAPALVPQRGRGGVNFRPGALKKLGAPPEMDAPVRLGQPYSVLVLILLIVLLLGTAIWAAVGSVPRTSSATGVLTHAEGSFVLQSPAAGQITAVFVSAGDRFPTGTPMFSVQVGERRQVVRSITSGRVTAVLGKVGEVIIAGSELAIIERIKEAADPLMAAVYVPGGEVGQLRAGDRVTMSVESVPAQQFGLLQGTVTVIGQFPETYEQVADFLGDSRLGTQFTSTGQPWKVLVELSVADTVSGFRWTTHDGPPYQIDSRTIVEAQFHLASLRPADWLVAR